MRKYECNTCGIRICTASYQGSRVPLNCTAGDTISHWHEVSEKTCTPTCTKLPDWVKECDIGYDNEQYRYFEVTNVDKKWIDIEYLDDGNGATCDYADIAKCSEARKRPFNEDEMKACPFCGDNAELRGGEGVASWIICNNKKCCATQGLELTGENAVQMWNTRPAEDAQQAKIRGLEKQLRDRADEGYIGFMLGIEQMKKKLAEKDREIERLKAALEEIASLRKLNPEMKANKFSSCAEDALRNLYCKMGDIAKTALANAPDAGKMEEK